MTFSIKLTTFAETEPRSNGRGVAATAARVYLDANASEPLRPQARDACLAAMASTANPASIHAAGRAARRRLEESREALAAALGLGADAADRIVFTSGGTEANALAVHALGQDRVVLVGATEHAAVRVPAGPEAEILPVGPDGCVDLDRLERRLRAVGPALVCLMAANNETGVLHPIEAALALCRRHGALLHVDAVQVPGRMAVPPALLAADAMALSAHKMGGLAGAGALVLGAATRLGRVPMAGGGQELGRRGGTPPLAAIAAFAAAAGVPPPEGLRALRDRIETACAASGAVILGAGAARLPNTSCIALPGRGAQLQLIALDLAGFEVSAGAACASGRIGRSEVLEAMRAGSLADAAIRVSLPWSATPADADAFIAAWRAMAAAGAGAGAGAAA